MKKIVSFVLVAIPFLLLLIYWADVPDQVPMHWTAQGEIDRYSESKNGILVLPCVGLGLFLLMFVFPRIDPKGNFAQFINTYWTIMNILLTFFLILFILTLMISLGSKIDQRMILHTSITVLFLLLGNYFGKIRANYFVGIRTPWTLESEEVWKKTHRMAGVLWVTVSVVMLPICMLFPAVSSKLFLPYVLTLAFVPTVYSFIIHKKLAKETPQRQDT